MPLNEQELLGSWSLDWAQVVQANEITDPEPFGARPVGFLHYLADGRMAALIAHRDRPAWPNGRLGASDTERLTAARSFVAYAGSFRIDGDSVIHHVEINSYPNDVDVDYVRHARIVGNRLELSTPPDLGHGQRPMRLSWRRLGG